MRAVHERRPTVEQLRAFLAVAEHEHVTKAAAALGLSQPSISHQLKALERSLGLAVFERVGRGVRLTADGRALLPAASSALAALRSLEEAAAARTGLLAGDLAVAASNTIGIYRVPEWAAGFLDRFPRIELRVQTVNTRDAIALLREAAADCALVEGPGEAGRGCRQRHPVLGAGRAGQAGLHRRQVQLHVLAVDRLGRRGVEEQPLLLGVGLDESHVVGVAPGEAQVVQRHLVDREDGAGGAVLR